MMVVAPSFQSMDNAVDVPEVNNGVNIEDAKGLRYQLRRMVRCMLTGNQFLQQT